MLTVKVETNRDDLGCEETLLLLLEAKKGLKVPIGLTLEALLSTSSKSFVTLSFSEIPRFSPVSSQKVSSNSNTVLVLFWLFGFVAFVVCCCCCC